MQVPNGGKKSEENHMLEAKMKCSSIRNSIQKREELIRENETMIIRIASRICRRPITKEDDEYAIALAGFDEAITSYDPAQRSSFLSFAYLVIHRRLIDFFRQEQRHRDHVQTVLGKEQNQDVDKLSFQKFWEDDLALLRRLEVAHFSRSLHRFGIKMADLVESSPKHQDTRENMLKVAQAIVAKPELLQSFYKEKRLGKEAARQLGFHPRTLRRHRNYLIALTLILVENLPLMREYLGLMPDEKGVGIDAEGNCDGGGGETLDCNG